METQNSQTLDSLIQASITSVMTSESIAKKVYAAADKAVSDSIDAAFGYNSEFRKSIQKAIGEVLPITRTDDLAGFSHAVRTLIQKRLASLASETAAEHVGKIIESLLPEGTTISMEDLKEAYEDKLKSQASFSDCHCEDSDDIAFAWNIERASTGEYWDLWLSPEEDASRYDKGVITLRFRPVVGDSSLHECWHASAGGSDMHINSLFIGPLYGFDAMVFRLGTGLAKLKHERPTGR